MSKEADFLNKIVKTKEYGVYDDLDHYVNCREEENMVVELPKIMEAYHQSELEKIMDEAINIIDDAFSCQENLFETGELMIGYGFAEKYKKLKKRIEDFKSKLKQ